MGRIPTLIVPTTVVCATIVGALLGGCAPSAAERLLAAGTATDYASAAEACNSLVQAARDPCLVDQIERLNLDDDACAAVQDPRWAGECRFRYAEKLVRAGETGRATTLCLTTPYSRECTYHLLRESARGVLNETPAVAAGALTPWLTEPGAHDAPKLFWKAYFRERRGEGGLDDPTGCPDEACTQAARETFFESLRAVFRADRAAFCARFPALPSGWAATPETTAWLTTWSADACTRDAGPAQAIPAPR